MLSSLLKSSGILLLIVLLSSYKSNERSGMPVHPFYISVTEMNYSATARTLEISCKMYTDDFEQTLKKRFNTPVDLMNPKDSKQLDNFVYQYVKDHLQMKVNGKMVSLNFVGFETEGESAWCYLEVKNIADIKSLALSNTLLFESYDSQINIIHAVVKGQRKSTKLVNPEKEAFFEF